MQKAITRILAAKKKQEKIIVFGDYDCDGVCASAVLWETLFELGCQALPFIPNREVHGYGLSEKAVDEILATGKPDILISVDNGITAKVQWKRLKKAGVFTILTDHHEPDKTVPKVDALIHTKQLCGTTVAWMLARELEREKAQSLLDLCALATIADQVHLTGANRSFAKFGLEQLSRTERLGLRLLIESSGLKTDEITSYSVNFAVVPRLNAMGRLGHAMDALRAICTKNRLRAQALVDKLVVTNINRQELTKELVELARSRSHEWEDEHIIVIEDKLFHEGVIGLIAGRLTEEFHKPSVVISVGPKTSKASARSIPGIHITNLLREVSEVLLDVGGHPQAAGFRIETSRIIEFRTVITDRAKTSISREFLGPSAEADCELLPALATLDTAKFLLNLEPFGQGNREPIFFLTQARIERLRQVGKEGRHLSLSIRLREMDTINAVAFGQGQLVESLEVGAVVSLLASLEVNSWKNKESLQLKVKQIIYL